MQIPTVGEYVQGTIGHYYQVLEVLKGGWQYRVQCMTPVDPPGTLIPIGTPVIVGRSDLRLQD